MNSDSDQTPYYVALSHFRGIGARTFKLLLSKFKKPQHIFHAKISDLSKILPEKTAEKFDTFRQENEPYSFIEALLKKNIQVVTHESPEWPSFFVHLADSPICLYARGDISVLKKDTGKCFGIVGTRRASPYGKYVAQLFGSSFAKHNFTIVSGMALGIDSAAHKAALSTQKPTIAVLGCGVDVVYPPQNQKLYQDIIAQGGVVISEYCPGVEPKPGLFVERNRLVSALSKGVLVVEGSDKSGALTTAKFAVQQGKEVYVPSHQITSPLFKAPTKLLRQNSAKLVAFPEDILVDYDISPMMLAIEQAKERIFNQEDNDIIELIGTHPQHPDDIADQLKKSVTTILARITELELLGVIEKNDQGEYYMSTQ